MEEPELPPPTCGKGHTKSEPWMNDSLFYEGKCKNGILHGKWKVTNSKGKIRQKGQFENGKKCGTWYTYHYYHNHETGKYILQNCIVENFLNDTLHGEFYIIDDHEKEKITSGYYYKGRKTGKWVIKNNYYHGYDFTEEYTNSDSCNCTLYSRKSENEYITGIIKNEQMIGHWETKDSSGNLLFSIHYSLVDSLIHSQFYWETFPFSGSIEGTVIQSHYNKKTETYFYDKFEYKNNKLHGPFQALNIKNSEYNDFHQTGIPTVNYGYYENGIKHGKFYSLRGADTLNTGNYCNGLQDGFWREYEYGHIIYEANFKMGRKNGPYSLYKYKGGKLISVETYSYNDSVYNGIYTFKNGNGILLEEGNYLNHKKHGEFNYYTETGFKFKTVSFNSGIPVKTIEYTSNDFEIFSIFLHPEAFVPEIKKIIFSKTTVLPNEKSWYRLHQKTYPDSNEILWVLFYDDTTLKFKTDLKYIEIK